MAGIKITREDEGRHGRYVARVAGIDAEAELTFTRGYKGPAINDANPVSCFPVVVKPEIPHSTEVGIKATLLNGKLGFNLSGFRNVVTDFQTQFYDPSVVAFVYGNAPRLVSQGVQLDLFGSPVRGLTLGGGLLYNDAKYGAGYNVACYQMQTAAQGCQAGGYTSAEGNQLAAAPRWKATANVQYAAPLGGNLEGFVGGDVVYQSRIDDSANRDPGTVIPEAAIFSARVGLRTSDERFGLSVFARNLFDVYRPVLKFATPTAAQQLDFAVYSSVPGSDSRRVIGVSFDARF
ncbi:MAG: TonB-dependent receptor [Proteobacteria bacterium]|nr:TonB-dependent receptor [Pseudomonadota bacterium]